MNPGYDWASRAGNRLGLWAVEHYARQVERRLQREHVRAARGRYGPAFCEPALRILTVYRDQAEARAELYRRDYDEWLARRPQ